MITVLKKKKPRSNLNNVRNWLVVVGFIMILSWSTCFILISLAPNENRAVAGQFGDSFGVVTSLFSGFAMIFALATVLIQNKELNEQRKELRLNRSESMQNRLSIALYNQISLTTDVLKVPILTYKALHDKYVEEPKSYLRVLRNVIYSFSNGHPKWVLFFVAKEEVNKKIQSKPLLQLNIQEYYDTDLIPIINKEFIEDTYLPELIPALESLNGLIQLTLHLDENAYGTFEPKDKEESEDWWNARFGLYSIVYYNLQVPLKTLLNEAIQNMPNIRTCLNICENKEPLSLQLLYDTLWTYNDFMESYKDAGFVDSPAKINFKTG